MEAICKWLIWDIIRLELPRLGSRPNFNTGAYTVRRSEAFHMNQILQEFYIYVTF